MRGLLGLKTFSLSGMVVSEARKECQGIAYLSAAHSRDLGHYATCALVGSIVALAAA